MPAKPPGHAGRGKANQGSAKPCPVCGKPASAASRPFCSERCRDVDLNRWLSNSYVIPAAKDDEEDAE
jgi:endogenous inhibitor of DNA gyrase (YacG/DUF329 family)